MTGFDRRSSDRRIDELKATIKASIVEAICDHIERDHYGMSKVEVALMIERADEREKVTERIVDMIEGVPIVDLHGESVGREPGMAKMVEQIYERTNGGVRVTQKIQPDWTRKQKIAAWSAAGMFVVGALSSIVTLVAVFAG